jgi:hypothetical protein
MIAIRFDGPPSHESGRFIEVERDGASISFGKWKQDGDDWLLELTEVAKMEQTLNELRKLTHTAEFIGGHLPIGADLSTPQEVLTLLSQSWKLIQLLKDLNTQ